MTLTHKILPVAQLTAGAIEQMFVLMQTYYGNMRRDNFVRDLSHKQGVLLVFDKGRTLCGFTTYALFEREFRGRPLSVLYSGDTVIDERYWGSLATTRLFTALLDEALRNAEHDLYWFLLSKGVRTYQLLPLYFRVYFPCRAQATPEDRQALIASLARQQFGACYDAGSGVVRLGDEGDFLRPAYDRPLTSADSGHADFFMTINPGYRRGDNVPCLARISPDNFQPIVSRWLKTIHRYELSHTLL